MTSGMSERGGGKEQGMTPLSLWTLGKQPVHTHAHRCMHTYVHVCEVGGEPKVYLSSHPARSPCVSRAFSVSVILLFTPLLPCAAKAETNGSKASTDTVSCGSLRRIFLTFFFFLPSFRHRCLLSISWRHQPEDRAKIWMKSLIQRLRQVKTTLILFLHILLV